MQYIGKKTCKISGSAVYLVLIMKNQGDRCAAEAAAESNFNAGNPFRTFFSTVAGGVVVSASGALLKLRLPVAGTRLRSAVAAILSAPGLCGGYAAASATEPIR